MNNYFINGECPKGVQNNVQGRNRKTNMILKNLIFFPYCLDYSEPTVGQMSG